MSAPLSPSDLIFPSAHTSINQTLSTLKKTHLSISNRLQSILHDATFVEKVATAYQLPLIANERCGSWYVRPTLKAGSAYFKSTDGHHGQWGFSLRRLNLQVLEIIGRSDGCIIVDSTRKGKSMPDALSKTVSIWVAVMNRLLFPEDSDAAQLQTPEDVVSDSEHAYIEQLLPGFVEEADSLRLDKQRLRAMLNSKPLKTVWVTPDSTLSRSTPKLIERNLVILCTASGRMSSEQPVAGYVQGAADDSESWALGMDAVTFWQHSAQLLSTSEDELPNVIHSLVSGSRCHFEPRQPVLITPTNNIWIADNKAAVVNYADFDIIMSCSDEPIVSMTEEMKSRYIHLCCTTGKVGSRQLRIQLQKIQPLLATISSKSQVLVTCHTGRDLSVGAALAVVCLCCSGDGIVHTNPTQTNPALNKTMIKHRLSWIMVSMPDAAPSRATLQSVNAFLLG